MPQSSGSLPSLIALRSAMIFSTRDCSLKSGGDRGQPLGERRELVAAGFRCPPGAVHSRPDVGLPVHRERRLVIEEHELVGVLARLQRLAIGLDHLVALALADHALALQAIGIELARARMLGDLLVHERLRDERLVLLVVALAAIAHEVDHHVLAELVRKSSAISVTITTASGSSPFTWKIGHSTIFATSVQ